MTELDPLQGIGRAGEPGRGGDFTFVGATVLLLAVLGFVGALTIGWWTAVPFAAVAALAAVVVKRRRERKVS